MMFRNKKTSDFLQKRVMILKRLKSILIILWSFTQKMTNGFSLKQELKMPTALVQKPISLIIEIISAR